MLVFSSAALFLSSWSSLRQLTRLIWCYNASSIDLFHLLINVLRLLVSALQPLPPPSQFFFIFTLLLPPFGREMRVLSLLSFACVKRFTSRFFFFFFFFFEGGGGGGSSFFLLGLVCLFIFCVQATPVRIPSCMIRSSAAKHAMLVKPFRFFLIYFLDKACLRQRERLQAHRHTTRHCFRLKVGSIKLASLV